MTLAAQTGATPPPPSVISLYPYQEAFFADDAEVLVGCWSRQAGKDFTTACLAVDHALRTGEAWHIVSLTQRQADATFAKCRLVADVFKRLLRVRGAATVADADYDEYDRAIDHWFRCRARTLHLPGGGSVTSLPGRSPDTLAGLTGNVIFTEFGLFPAGGYDHWRVVFPLTTRGFRVVVISTPRGRNTKFYELVDHPDDQVSVHRVDIHRAVADGMPLGGEGTGEERIAALRRRYNDEAGWRREYLLEFCGDLTALLTWAKLQAAGGDGGAETDVLEIAAGAGWDPSFFDAMGHDAGRYELGWDVARSGHVSALWCNLAAPGKRRTPTYLVLMRNTPFGLQREVVATAMRARPDTVGCGDATGLGMQANEELEAEFGDRWRGVTFTTANKRAIGSALRTAFDDGDQRIPAMDGPLKYVATDLYAVQADETGGQLRLAETPNPLLEDSHCDIAYACGLARRAAAIAPAGGHLWVA